MKYRQREAGGQLFANFVGNQIIIVEATGPRSTDRRTRTSYIPIRKVEQEEILSRYQRGFHYVGDWHTHPEEIPRPSVIDEESIAECVGNSVHSLYCFVLIIVGRVEPPAGLHVMVHDGKVGITLRHEVLVKFGI